MNMNKTNFRKASAVCLALTLSLLETQALTALPVLADEEITADEEASENEAADQSEMDEESEEEEIIEDTAEETVLEDPAEETAVDSEEEASEDKEASKAELDTAACLDAMGGVPEELTGSVSERLAQLQEYYPEGHWLRQDDFTFASYCFYCVWDEAVAADWSYARPSSIDDIAPGDLVQVYTSNKQPYALIVTAVNKDKKTITGGGLSLKADHKVSWGATFKLDAVDYVISPDSPKNNLKPGKDVDTSLFYNYSSESEDEPEFSVHVSGYSEILYSHELIATNAIRGLAGCWGNMTYISPNLVRYPGYRILGWKVKLDSDQFIKYADYKELGEKFGIGDAEEEGINLNYYADADGDIVFEPGNAFWADRSLESIPRKNEWDSDDGSHFEPKYRSFYLVPLWETDPDYELPASTVSKPDNSDPSAKPDTIANPFDDIKKSEWYYDWVTRANEAGLMTGLNSTHFGPNDKMTRAMVVTVLYRMAGSPQLYGSPEHLKEQAYPDVPNGQWYTNAIKWAKGWGVATGYDNGKFGPDDHITREQLATMICRYQRNVARKRTSYYASLDKFPDKNNVNDFAKSSVQYCVARGIITGSNGYLLPTDNATRAECAKMLLVTNEIR